MGSARFALAVLGTLLLAPQAVPTEAAAADIGVVLDQAKAGQAAGKGRDDRGRQSIDRRCRGADRRPDGDHRQGLRRHQHHRARSQRRGADGEDDRGARSARGADRGLSRASMRETYNCSPICEPRIMLGRRRDSYFDGIIGQTTNRSGLAQGNAPASPTNSAGACERPSGMRRRPAASAICG